MIYYVYNIMIYYVYNYIYRLYNYIYRIYIYRHIYIDYIYIDTHTYIYIDYIYIYIYIYIKYPSSKITAIPGRDPPQSPGCRWHIVWVWCVWWSCWNRPLDHPCSPGPWPPVLSSARTPNANIGTGGDDLKNWERSRNLGPFWAIWCKVWPWSP